MTLIIEGTVPNQESFTVSFTLHVLSRLPPMMQVPFIDPMLCWPRTITWKGSTAVLPLLSLACTATVKVGMSDHKVLVETAPVREAKGSCIGIKGMDVTSEPSVAVMFPAKTPARMAPNTPNSTMFFMEPGLGPCIKIPAPPTSTVGVTCTDVNGVEMGVAEMAVEVTKDVEVGEDWTAVEVTVTSIESSEDPAMEIVEEGIISMDVVFMKTALEV